MVAGLGGSGGVRHPRVWLEIGGVRMPCIGGSTHFKKDGSIVTTHKDGGSFTFDKDGNVSMDTKDRNVTITSGKGSQTFSAKSQSFTADAISIKGKVALNGSLTSTGPVTGGSGGMAAT